MLARRFDRLCKRRRSAGIRPDARCARGYRAGWAGHDILRVCFGFLVSPSRPFDCRDARYIWRQPHANLSRCAICEDQKERQLAVAQAMDRDGYGDLSLRKAGYGNKPSYPDALVMGMTTLVEEGFRG